MNPDKKRVAIRVAIVAFSMLLAGTYVACRATGVIGGAAAPPPDSAAANEPPQAPAREEMLSGSKSAVMFPAQEPARKKPAVFPGSKIGIVEPLPAPQPDEPEPKDGNPAKQPEPKKDQPKPEPKP